MLAFNKTGLQHARRFGDFLSSCASRPDVFDRVSLPYLRWRANTHPPNFPSNVLLTLQACGAPGQPPSPYSLEARKSRSLSDDPTVSTLLTTSFAAIASAKTKSGRPLHDWVLDSRFGELAYREFRCSWLHEGRSGEATHSFDLSTETEPTYLTNDSPLGGRETNWLVTVQRPQGLVFLVFVAPDRDYQNYLQGHSLPTTQRFVGEIKSYDKDKGLAEIDVKNKFAVGDKLEVITPQGNQTIELQHMEDLKGNDMNEALGGGYQVRISLPPANYELSLLARFQDETAAA